ncbi:AbrB family transcriptional regulator [Azospira restricta]|uniref:AbrB family transcriptional regulator n=1 Tax=Azospira restricta TaxID=404405 RepID=A0A974SMQ9_9RHOO|nr:AbrB family transcriptional regulator [Azospira restricta]QRJ63281.1 AbrB family transcriptional regulator [Azospira restricta]
MIVKALAALSAALRIAATLLLAGLAGWLASAAGSPLPWMLGPLFAVAAASLAGARPRVLPGGRALGQWAIGCALGLHFSPAVVALLAQQALPIALLALLSVAIGVVGALLLLRWTDATPATAFFAALPGGASEMVVLAEHRGGAVERVAAAQALRVVVVVLVVPFALLHWTGNGVDLPPPARPAGTPALFAALVAASLGALALLHRLRIANAWLLGPLAGVGLLAALGAPLPALPAWLVDGGQLLLGSALGSRFGPSFFRAAPRFLGVAALAIGLALLLSAAGALLLARGVALPAPALLLAAAPGGIAEMSVTAAVMHWSVPLVIAAHLARLVLLTACGAAIYRLFLALPVVRAIGERRRRD